MNIRNHKFKLVKKIRPKNILILLISILFGSCQNNTEQKIIAQQGIFDLTNINIEKGNIKLDGEWEFYWKKLYSPKDFQENKLIPDTFVNCPSDWNNYLINGEKLTGKGFATYKLTVKTSPDNKRFAIKTTYQSTAFNLFVNGELFIENGVVSDNSKNMRAQYLPSVAIFETNLIENEIIIQISNNHHQKGGFRAPILFGTKTNILKQRDKSVTKDAFIAGLLLIMSIFAFGLFIFRSNDKISLIFSVFTFVFFIRTIVTGECLLIYFFPTISWKLQYLLEYISWFSMITIAVIYISYFFPKYSNKIITNVFIFITVAFSLIAIIGNSYITSKLITPQAVVIIIALAYILIMFFRSLKKSKESFLMLIGILIIALTGLNDILSFMDILNTPYFLPAGIIIFIITQALALSVHVFKTEKEKIQIEKQKHIIENKNRQLNIVKEKLEEHEQQLQKRVKELNGLFSLGLLTEKHEKLIDIYTEFTNKIVPESMQFPDKVYVLLEIDDQKYSNIKDYFLPKNKKCLTAKINLFKKQNGNLIVSYTDNLPFLENFEQELINAYAERISEITERTKTKKALKDSEMRWQFAVDGSELGLWDWSIPDNYVFFSKQWKRMIGYNNDEILDFSEEWSNRIHPDDKDKVFADVNKHIDGKVPFYTNEHRLKCKDG
ncbi:MAG: PAS domain-containing protein, partial [Bacteroidales bacterium]|nr:PAS domain-containing protein [Bacteroidales bacterium]